MAIDWKKMIIVRDEDTVSVICGKKILYAKGLNGRGITSIAKTGISGLVDTYTITYTDGTTSTYTIKNGRGIVNISKTGTVDLVDTYTIQYSDGTTSTYNVTNGQDFNHDIIAEEFDVQIAYSVGDYVIYEGELYKFVEVHPAGAWNASHAEITSISDELKISGLRIVSIELTDEGDEYDTYTITYSDGSTLDFQIAHIVDTYTKDEIDDLLDDKQNALTFDNTPTQGSANPVTSGGIYSALSNYYLSSEVDEKLNEINEQITKSITKTSDTHWMKITNSSSAQQIASLVYGYKMSLAGISWLEVSIRNRNIMASNFMYGGIPGGYVYKGVRFTQNDDDSITFAGTPTEDIDLQIGALLNLPIGQYYLSGGVDDNCYLHIFGTEIKSKGNEILFSANAYTSQVMLYLHITNTGEEVSGTFYPMVRFRDDDGTYIKSGFRNYSLAKQLGTEYNPIPLYGGNYDFVTAQVVKTCEHIDNYQHDPYPFPGDFIADNYDGSDPAEGASVTYELEEPVNREESYRLTGYHLYDGVTYLFANNSNAVISSLEAKTIIIKVVEDLQENKADKTDVYTKAQIDSIVDTINSFEVHICTAGEYDPSTLVPSIANPDESTFYLVPTNGGQSDIFTEWIYVDSHWEKFGSATVDLSGYYTKTETDALLDDKADADGDISGKPSTFPPSSHNHDDRYYTESETDTLLAAKADSSALGALASKDQADWDTDITDIPQTFPPSSHTHDDRYYTESEMDTALNGKADASALADVYDESGTYQDGDIVVRNGKLYRLTIFTPSDLTEIQVGAFTFYPDNYYYYGNTIYHYVGSGNLTITSWTTERLEELIQSCVNDGYLVVAGYFDRINFIEITVEELINATVGSPAWGNITGTLSNQTDLQTALSGKSDTGHTHDDRYYTETETDTLLSAKANSADVYTKSETDALLDDKQDALTFDDVPTDGSDNPVKSNGIYDALATKQDTLTFDNIPTANSNNPVKSGGIKTALDTKQDTLTFDNSPTADSNNPVTSGGVKTALDAKSDILIKSASGAIASFDDGIEAPAGNVTVAIEPVQEGTGDPSPDNVRPITGWAGVNVMRTGKNLFDELSYPFINNVSITGTTGNPSLSENHKSSSYIPCSHIQDKIITLNKRPSGLYVGIAFYSSNKTYISGIINNNATEGTPWTFSVPSNAVYMRFTTGLNATDIQLELGSTATAYEPYQGDTYDISFGSAGTVYGGSLDVKTGRLTVDRAIASSTFGQLNSKQVIGNVTRGYISLDSALALRVKRINSICNLTIWMENHTADTPHYYINTNCNSCWIFLPSNSDDDLSIQVVYYLAEPRTYQLTPTEVTTLLGQNRIWADTGDVDVSYFTEAGEDVGKAINNVSKSAKYDDDKTRKMITQSSESAMTASKNYTAGNLIIINDKLLRATANIASGGTITIGTNAEEVDLDTIIAEKAEKILVAKLPFLSSADLYNNTADFHNAMPRGKDITAYLTDGSLWKRINGTNGYSLFEDLYVGDTITAGGQTYVIVDFDYYIRTGDSVDFNQHHLVMMPSGRMSIPEGTVLYNPDTSATPETLTFINTANAWVEVNSQETADVKKWNATMADPNTNSTAGGYKYSRMRQVIMRCADTIVVNAFGVSHVKPIQVIYPNPADASASGLASNWTWFKNTNWTAPDRMSICDLPNEVQMYGTQAWGRGSTFGNGGYEIGIDEFQFALFKNNRAKVNIRAAYWFRGVGSATVACSVGTTGLAITYGSSTALGVRPRFLLVG